MHFFELNLVTWTCSLRSNSFGIYAATAGVFGKLRELVCIQPTYQISVEVPRPEKYTLQVSTRLVAQRAIRSW